LTDLLSEHPPTEEQNAKPDQKLHSARTGDMSSQSSHNQQRTPEPLPK